MMQIIGVRIKPVEQIYPYLPNQETLKIGDFVIVKTPKGQACGTIVSITQEENSEATTPILRLATERDLLLLEKNQKKEQEAFLLFKKKIIEHKLEMKATEVEFAFEGNKIIFYFTADGRIDFRLLVKDLAHHYKTRIELRQIGVRDQAKSLGGIAICGQQFCCSRFLTDFHSVSIKMAKEQTISLNPTKLSGSCGRLKCCLKYEQKSYEELSKNTPKVGETVNTPEGLGTVLDANLLTSILKIKLESKEILVPKFYHKKDLLPLDSSKKEKKPFKKSSSHHKKSKDRT